MDIAISKKIEYKKMENFLQYFFKNKIDVIQNIEKIRKTKLGTILYCENNTNVETDFPMGISLYLSSMDEEKIQEISKSISKYFQCMTVCSSAKLEVEYGNPFTCILFNNGIEYIADDLHFEENGKVKILKELK